MHQLTTLGEQKENWSEEACGDFAKRVRRFGVEVEELTLKPAPGPPKRTVDEQRAEEGKDILSRVNAGEGALPPSIWARLFRSFSRLPNTSFGPRSFLECLLKRFEATAPHKSRTLDPTPRIINPKP